METPVFFFFPQNLDGGSAPCVYTPKSSLLLSLCFVFGSDLRVGNLAPGLAPRNGLFGFCSFFHGTGAGPGVTVFREKLGTFVRPHGRLLFVVGCRFFFSLNLVMDGLTSSFPAERFPVRLTLRESPDFTLVTPQFFFYLARLRLPILLAVAIVFPIQLFCPESLHHPGRGRLSFFFYSRTGSIWHVLP